MVTNRDHWTDLEAMGFEEQEGVYDTRIEAEETIAEYEGKEDPIFHELKGMEAGKYVDYLRSHRGLSDVEISHLTSLREVGISIPKIYQSFAAQVGSFNLVRFTKQDMYNEV
ncbi:hypothetical protein Ahy_A07g033479 [Arachis hypogaea]|uniref:Uncharacterized protein n=1 Tax=Arachis hypogaea TaxID=3818 RepID=A0A445C9D5_ARAHY|nr:hypothetical protein Ahy_A07g033479 [Arachis hypogaea]